ncbi:CACTA en-spm transposon protein [Cucumis melo var. makuwa]|uniref:CACTA en-spm transposon protein n=1 Tax=Cucumis melo var. makuwa TaxID=1194695 RepID=A0A5A7UUP1_CUCMM|nr:CACTA en-spm transposon protein [Cucumis melo var. makuwa]
MSRAANGDCQVMASTGGDRETVSARDNRWVVDHRKRETVSRGERWRAMNRVVEYQMLTTFMEFQGDCHRHFKKYNDPEEARANPPNNKMLKLQSQPTLEGSQPLSGNEICDQVVRKRPGYSKDLGWGSKPKARKTTSASSSTTSCSQSATEREIKIQAKLVQALERIELQDRNFQVLASEMEQTRKLI